MKNDVVVVCEFQWTVITNLCNVLTLIWWQTLQDKLELIATANRGRAKCPHDPTAVYVFAYVSKYTYIRSFIAYFYGWIWKPHDPSFSSWTGQFYRLSYRHYLASVPVSDTFISRTNMTELCAANELLFRLYVLFESSWSFKVIYSNRKPHTTSD